jgi:hypothetical protein
VGIEIFGIWHTHKMMLQHNKTPYDFAVLQLNTDEWRENRRVLAQHLDEDTWWAAEMIATTVGQTRVAIETLGTNQVLPKEMAEALQVGMGAAAGFFEELTGREVTKGGLSEKFMPLP